MADRGKAMSELDDFKSQFDEEGRFRDHDGTLNVAFRMLSGPRFPGKLHFSNNLCVRAEMDKGRHWDRPDHSPLHGNHFELDFGEQRLQGIAFYQGRVLFLREPENPWSRRDFLRRFQIARNLFVHPQRIAVGGSIVDTDADSLARAAIWLTPKSVAGFDADDFQELGPVRQAELQTAVQSFLAVATQVPADRLATAEEYRQASVPFARILEILKPYVLVTELDEQVEAAIRTVEFPPWVVNWDFELDDDSAGTPAVWVKVYGDNEPLPRLQLGRTSYELGSKIREALIDHQINRYAYIRMSTALLHKVG